MAEETTQETAMADSAAIAEDVSAETSAAAVAEEEPQSDRPDPVLFAGYLFGGWLALMIVFVVIAVIAMSVLG